MDEDHLEDRVEIKLELNSPNQQPFTSTPKDGKKKLKSIADDLGYQSLFKEDITVNRKNFVCLIVGDLQGASIPSVLSLASENSHYKSDWEYDC